ncbi:MAG: penicillin-binding transpeptidase domain-containing protein [Faecousia sp.]
MNKVMTRVNILTALILLLAIGTCFFVGDFLLNAEDWASFPGSPHVYNAGNIGCGLITDRENILLADLTEGKVYSSNSVLRKSTVHWLGDRLGSISAPALSSYTNEIVGFNLIDGVYNFGGTGGQASLTISAKLQMVALEAMGDYHGTVAVYNYKTGEILCAVTTPTYDPDQIPDWGDDPSGAYEGVYLNRFTQCTYTPGSIFKLVTAAAALESIPDIMDRTFTCRGTYEYGIDRVTCYMAHGEQNLEGAVKNSCNCVFAQIADLLGADVLQRYIDQFGVTESLTFDGITTAKGNVSLAGEADVMVAWSAIGQHKDLINPCSYMTFVGAIASGGIGVEPHLVSKVTSGGKTTYTAQSVSTGRLMSSGTAKKLQQFMASAQLGYPNNVLFEGLTVCGKSGTAEVGEGIAPNGTFTGFVADEAYPLAFICVVENGGSGAEVCMPILAKVLLACKDMMDAP